MYLVKRTVEENKHFSPANVPFKIWWQQKITNRELLRRTTTLSSLVTFGGWGASTFQKLYYNGKLVVGKCNVGWLRLCYKDACKHDPRNINIGLDELKDFSDFLFNQKREVRKETEEENTKKNIFLCYFHGFSSISVCFGVLQSVSTPRMAKLGCQRAIIL